MSTYTIKLPVFEGPFDLLLFFIERDELDIYNIPIATVTNDFLAYIRAMKALNVDLASEFILVAATLMRIKAKMLLPRKPVDEEGNEIDPREELVSRLLEYTRYKSVLEEMRAFEEDRALRNYRGNTLRELKDIATKALVDVEMEHLTLFKLLKVFENVMQRFEDTGKTITTHTIVNYNYTIQDQRAYIYSMLQSGKQTEFKTIFEVCKDKMHAIITFLAMLEMLNLQEIKAVLGLGTNNLWLMEVETNV